MLRAAGLGESDSADVRYAYVVVVVLDRVARILVDVAVAGVPCPSVVPTWAVPFARMGSCPASSSSFGKDAGRTTVANEDDTTGSQNDDHFATASQTEAAYTRPSPEV